MAQLVARGVWDAEVASSSLVAPTNQGGEIKKSMLFFIEPTQIGMFFTKAEKHTILKKDHLVVVFYVNYILRTCGTSQGVDLFHRCFRIDL